MIEELRSIDLFEDLTDEQLALWCEGLEIRAAEDGERLLTQGVMSPGPLLLFEGTTQQYTEVDGRKDPANPNHGPTWIGAIAAITDGPLPISIDADGPCRVAIIPRERFKTLAMQQPSVHAKVMHVIGPVMRGMNARESSRERLTSLGTMAAGLAHELNNPAAAARRAASDLVEAVEVINHALEAFVTAGVEREQAGQLLELQQEALLRCAARREMDALESSDATDAMEDLLADHGVQDGWRYAETLATVGIDEDWLDRVADDRRLAAEDQQDARLDRGLADRPRARGRAGRVHRSHVQAREGDQDLRLHGSRRDRRGRRPRGSRQHADHAQAQAQAHARSRSSATTTSRCRS